MLDPSVAASKSHYLLLQYIKDRLQLHDKILIIPKEYGFHSNNFQSNHIASNIHKFKSEFNHVGHLFMVEV